MLILLLMVPLIGLSAAVVSQGARHVSEREASRGRKLALLNAESGIDRGVAQLLSSASDLSELSVSYEQGKSLRYLVSVDNLGMDGLDNDGDLLIDEEDEASLRRLDSRGSLNVADYGPNGAPIATGSKFFTKRVQAYGRTYVGLPAFPWAVYLGDPNAELQVNGNAFKIDGNDYSVEQNLTGNDAVIGIATTGDPQDIVDQLATWQQDNVDGEGGDPSVGNVTAVDLQQYIDEYKSGASLVFNGTESVYTGDLGAPTNGGFITTYASGNLEISSGSVGAGLLLVEGDLTITGAFEFTGVVIVTGQVIFRGGGGEKRVVGSVLVGGDVIEDQTVDHEQDLTVSGTVDLLYSEEAQSKVGDYLSTFTIFGWQEM